MKTIWKYAIPVGDNFGLMLPAGARVLSVGVQGEQPCIWVLIDPEAETEPRRFAVVGTGHSRAGLEFMRFVGTFQLLGGRLVFHLFEVAA